MIRNTGLVLLALPCLALLLFGLALGGAGRALSWAAMRGFDAIVLIFDDRSAR